MKKSLLFLAAGFALGYVLGARAGRERYEQLKDVAGSLTDRPEVQKAMQTAKDTFNTARDKTSGLWQQGA